MTEEFRRLYPFQGRFWDRQGLKLHYLDEGKGEPVVMLHGNPSWSFYYRNLAKDLKDDFRVIVPDHIGMGLSDKPGDDRYDYTLQSRVDDLDNLLGHLKIDGKITLVLHDWGGMIGAAWAVQRPERVKRLVVLNTAAFFPPEGSALPWQLSLARSGFGKVLVRGLNAFVEGAATGGCVQRPMTAELRAAYAAPYDSWLHRIAVQRFIQDIPVKPGDKSYDLVKRTSETLGRLSGIPMLLLWGGRDFVFHDEFYREWLRRFPKAEAHRFAEAGHYVLEDAYPEILPLVRGFLKRQEP